MRMVEEIEIKLNHGGVELANARDVFWNTLCICEVALVSGPVRGRKKRGETRWLPVSALTLSADVLGVPLE